MAAWPGSGGVATQERAEEGSLACPGGCSGGTLSLEKARHREGAQGRGEAAAWWLHPSDFSGIQVSGARRGSCWGRPQPFGS